MNYPKEKTQQGFTLIELLVVIAIIGILSTITMASLNAARIKARDVRRKGDLHALELAIQLYYDTNGTFPNNDTSNNTGDWSAAYKAQLAPYISSVPIDPLLNDAGRYYGSYRMTWAPDASCNGQYVIWAYIEGDNAGANTCGFGGPHYFRVLGKF